MLNNETFSNETFHSLDYWLNLFGSTWYQEIIFLTFLPIGLVGFILNTIGYIVFKMNNDFELPFYVHLRAYTLNSICLSLLLSTRFVNNSRRFFNFSNTVPSMEYFGHFYIPAFNFLYFYQSCLNIVLTIDRIVALSNRFQYFKKLKATVVAYLVFSFSFIIVIANWINNSDGETKINLNQTVIFTFHYVNIKISNNLYFRFVTNGIVDIIPVASQLILLLIVVYLLRSYSTNVGMIRNMTSSGLGKINFKLSRHQLNNRLTRTISTPTMMNQQKRTQIELTILTITLSSFSLL
jgi:hypothetical protein